MNIVIAFSILLPAMKHFVFSLLLIVVSYQASAQQKDIRIYNQKITTLSTQNTEAKTELVELDATADNPFSKSMLTDRTYDKLVYKDQQAIGGSIIREGKAVGSSATVEDKAVTLNLGSPVMFNWLAVQANVRGSSEDKFVTIFSDGDYQKTLSAGGTALIFLRRNTSTYKEGDRLSLHRTLRKRRFENEGAFDGEFRGSGLTKNKNKWHAPDTPNDAATWISAKHLLVNDFIAKRNDFLNGWEGLQGNADWIEDYYKDKLHDSLKANALIKQKYKEYLRAENEVADILSADWAGWDFWEETEFIIDSLIINSTDYLSMREKQNSLRKYKTALATYDTIQLKAPWVHRYRAWISLKASYNAAKQPLFDGSKPDKGYKSTYTDEYGDYLASINYLIINAKSKYYFSGGGGITDMLGFDKDKLRTYQSVSLQPNGGADSVQVVKQSQAYPELPKELLFKTVQLQFAAYWTKVIGIDVTYKGKFAKNYADRNAATFGVFFPIQAGETTLLFMPQAKWADHLDKPWTWGFNLSASIPGFVTKGK